MINLGLPVAGRRAVSAALIVPNRVRVRVLARDLGGDARSNLTPYLDDGQVNIDATADVTSSLTVTLDDPKRALPFDTDHPADTALWHDRILRVNYDVLVAGDWQPIPRFTGPVTGMSRDGRQVSIECQGKEILFLGAAWSPLTLHKGMKKTDAIRRILAEANPVYAETRIDIPDLAAVLPKPISLTRDSVPWHVARRIARSMGMQLFYDGRGVCRLRRRPGTVGFTFTGEHHVISSPRVTYSDQIVNAVYVLGAVPKGSKTHVHATAVAPANHPLSPERVGRYLLPDGQVTRDDSIKTVAEAKTRANRRLEDGLRQGIDVEFDAIPGPGALLEPLDLCHVSTDDLSATFRLQRFSMPLVVGQPLTVGYHKPLPARHRHAHRHRPATRRKKR